MVNYIKRKYFVGLIFIIVGIILYFIPLFKIFLFIPIALIIFGLFGFILPTFLGHNK